MLCHTLLFTQWCAVIPMRRTSLPVPFFVFSQSQFFYRIRYLLSTMCVFCVFKHYSRCFYLFFFFSVNKNVPGSHEWISRLIIDTTKWRKGYICVRIIYIVYKRKKNKHQNFETHRGEWFLCHGFLFLFPSFRFGPAQEPLSPPSLCTRDRSYKITHTQKKKTSLSIMS